MYNNCKCFDISWLSHNLLSGGLSDCWFYSPNLEILNFESYNLPGVILDSMSSLYSIGTLQLRKQLFDRHIACSFCKLHWYGIFGSWGQQLCRSAAGMDWWKICLRSNKFHESIPSTLCQLSSVQSLDLSFNNLQGAIPTCLNNFTSMTSNQSSDKAMSNFYYFPNIGGNITVATIGEYINYAWLSWKDLTMSKEKLLAYWN